LSTIHQNLLFGTRIFGTQMINICQLPRVEWSI